MTNVLEWILGAVLLLNVALGVYCFAVSRRKH